MYANTCEFYGCNENTTYYRDLDDSPRPICSKHYNGLNMMEKRHYVKIGGK